MIIVLVDDLFFSSKIFETARQLRCHVQVVADRDALIRALESSPNLEKLIFDLNCKRCNAVDLIREVRQHRPTLPTLAFGSHVQTHLILAAQEAGCDHVVARSYFSAHLPEILGQKVSAT